MKSSFGQSAFAAAVVASTFLVAGANAQTLPAATFSATAAPSGPVGSGYQHIDTTGSVTASVSNAGGTARGTASVFSQYVSVEVTSTAGVDFTNQGYATASETYYFSIVGDLNESVPLLVTGSGHTHSTGGGYVDLTENINNAANYFTRCVVGSGCGDFSYSQSVGVMSNTVAFVSLSAFAVVQGGSLGGWIDPMLTIDPNFADASHFHLAFSNGISNGTGGVPTVPEPGTWAMMIGGLGLMTAGLRRRGPSAAASFIRA